MSGINLTIFVDLSMDTTQKMQFYVRTTNLITDANPSEFIKDLC
jgi:hypothetical protein